MPYGMPESQWRAAREEMRAALVDRARRRCTITYGDLAREIGAARLEPRHRRFAALLNEVCELEDAGGRPMLGSLVVRSDTGMPGAGYFREARVLGRDASADRRFWEAELEAVFGYWDMNPAGAPTRESR